MTRKKEKSHRKIKRYLGRDEHVAFTACHFSFHYSTTLATLYWHFLKAQKKINLPPGYVHQTVIYTRRNANNNSKMNIHTNMPQCHIPTHNIDTQPKKITHPYHKSEIQQPEIIHFLIHNFTSFKLSCRLVATCEIFGCAWVSTNNDLWQNDELCL